MRDWLSGFLDRLGLDGNKLCWGVGLFLVTFTISLVIVGVILVKLPATFFLDRHCRDLWVDRHPALRWTGVVLKNLLGVLLVVLGILLSLPGIPGQGILTILIGVILLDFPGKRRMERYLVSRPRVLRTINRLRARYGRPPLVLDECEPPASEQDELVKAGERGELAPRGRDTATGQRFRGKSQ